MVFDLPPTHPPKIMPTLFHFIHTIMAFKIADIQKRHERIFEKRKGKIYWISPLLSHPETNKAVEQHFITWVKYPFSHLVNPPRLPKVDFGLMVKTSST